MGRGSKTLLIIILVLAAILGLGALGLLWYNSTLNNNNDGDNTTTTSPNKCNQIFLLSASNDPIDTDATLLSSEPIFIGAEFQIRKSNLPDMTTGENVDLEDFGFAFITNDNSQPTIIRTAKVEESGDYFIFKPQYQFSDYGSKTTLSIVADIEAEDNIELSNSLGANSSCAAVYEVEVTGGGGNCVVIGQTGTIDQQQCCTGLTQVDSCTAPDSNNQCTLEVPDCFTCVNAIGDNLCGAGENVCNSPDDCSTAQPPEEPADLCIAANGTGSSGDQCCAGLNQFNCRTTNSSNSCTEADASCFKCLTAKPDDGVCESGENVCNSFNDCQDEIIPPSDPEPPSNGGGNQEEGDFDPVPPTDENSNFTVTISSSRQCVERMSPNNTLNITITIRNAASTSQRVMEVTNALPLGFTYVAHSAVINGVTDSTDQYLTSNNIGDSRELVWSSSSGWSVPAGGNMTITFSTLAAQNALTGVNLNEVVITPEAIPVNNSTLRASLSLNVEQNCSTPQTAIFGNSTTKIIAGIIALIIALVFYITAAGELVSMKLAGNKVVRDQAEKVRMIHLKKNDPREYFEEKFRKTKK